MKIKFASVFVAVVVVGILFSGCGDKLIESETDLSNEEISQMSDIEKSVSMLVQSDAFMKLSLDERADKVVSLLKEQGAVNVMVDLDNSMVSYQYPSGVMAGVLLEPLGGSMEQPPVNAINTFEETGPNVGN